MFYSMYIKAILSILMHSLYLSNDYISSCIPSVKESEELQCGESPYLPPGHKIPVLLSINYWHYSNSRVSLAVLYAYVYQGKTHYRHCNMIASSAACLWRPYMHDLKFQSITEVYTNAEYGFS